MWLTHPVTIKEDLRQTNTRSRKSLHEHKWSKRGVSMGQISCRMLYVNPWTYTASIPYFHKPWFMLSDSHWFATFNSAVWAPDAMTVIMCNINPLPRFTMILNHLKAIICLLVSTTQCFSFFKNTLIFNISKNVCFSLFARRNTSLIRQWTSTSIPSPFSSSSALALSLWRLFHSLTPWMPKETAAPVMHLVIHTTDPLMGENLTSKVRSSNQQHCNGVMEMVMVMVSWGIMTLIIITCVFWGHRFWFLSLHWTQRLSSSMHSRELSRSHKPSPCSHDVLFQCEMSSFIFDLGETRRRELRELYHLGL